MSHSRVKKRVLLFTINYRSALILYEKISLFSKGIKLAGIQ